MSFKKAFVTGADGMLGSSICRELIDRDISVKALCTIGRKASTLTGLDIEVVFGDVLDKKLLTDAIHGCDGVIHTAALTTLWPRRSKEIKLVNITGTTNVVQAVKENGIKRMVHIGTANSFTYGTKRNPGNENTTYSGWKYRMDYLDSKYAAQKMLIEEHSKNSFPVVIINPTFMMGPYDSVPSSGAILLFLYKGKVPGYSNGGRNFICSTDVAKAAVNALTKGRTGQCYIVGNANIEYKEFFMKACKMMSKPFRLKRVPDSMILSLGFSSSVIARLFNTKPALSYGMAKMATVSQYYSSAKAISELDLPQTPIERGIEQCLEWFRDNKYIL